MKHLFLLSLFVSNLIFAQPELDYYFPFPTTFDPEIPTPRQVLGYQVGEKHVSHEHLVKYMHALAGASDRVGIETYGYTYEQRPLLLLTISDPENLKRIESIRETHLKLSDPNRAEEINITEQPAVIWLGYSVHGNEPSGANASLLVAYYLAAETTEELQEQLKNEIILIDPCINPDGYSRFSQWVNQFRSQVTITDPNNIEHNEPWPGGRTNHYWFDLNRDWLPVQHPESSGRLKKFHEWHPNILTDHHEMGSNATFFFQPGIPSRNNPNTPENTFTLTNRIANYHAMALDRLGSLYYSRESFDDYYYGKGSTYPDVNGGVGILFEQASSRGHARETESGILEFPFTIRNQVTVSLSTLTAGVELREDLLDHQKNFYIEALKRAADDQEKAYIFDHVGDQGKIYHFLKILLAHKIKVYELASPVTANGHQFNPETSFIVPLSQVQYRLIKSLFEKRTEFEDSLFYDVSAWTLPLAFDLSYSELDNRIFKPELLGNELKNIQKPSGRLIGKSDYGYLIRWDDYYSPYALNFLQNNGIKVKCAKKQFTTEQEETYSEGTLFIPVGLNDHLTENLEELLEKAAVSSGLDIIPLNTGYTEQGIDMGSPNMEILKKPEILMLVGDHISSYESGEVWHLLDYRYRIPVSLVPVSIFNRTNLSRYNTLILTSGNYDGISKNALEKLKNWVEEGGNIVAMKGGAKWLANQGLAHIQFRTVLNDSMEIKPYSHLSRDHGAQAIGGSIFRTSLDLSHPLCYGFKENRLSIFKNGRYFFERSKNPYNNPVIYTDMPLESGYISLKNYEKIKGASAVIVSSIGRGKTVCFSDNPNFRAFWFGTNRLFLNAIYFADLISSRSAR